MPATRVGGSSFQRLVAAVCGLVAAWLVGCGGPSPEMQLPDQARKTVERRKVDVQARPAKPSPGAVGSRVPSQ
jgi:hypothetical protein